MDRSYGVNVAKLAGLPNEITERADNLLQSLENQSNLDRTTVKEIAKTERPKDVIRDALKELDPMTLSPLDALNYLIDLKKKVR